MLLASVSSLSFYLLHEKTFLWIKGWDRDLCLQIPLLIKFKYAVNHFLCCRKKLRILQGKERKTHNQRSNNSSRNKSGKDRKTFFHDRDSSAKYDSKYHKSDKVNTEERDRDGLTQLEKIAIENSLLLSR